MDFIAYDDKGQILWVMRNSSVDERETEMAQSFCVMEGTADDDTQYVKDGVITDRPSMNLSVDKTTITANGADEATISNIPSGATATCEGESLTIDDGELVFTADTAGIYTIKFECWPYLDEEVTINAT